MIISATEFQQNVGHYLKLAEAGTIINVQKSKPVKAMFQIVSIPNNEISKDQERIRQFIETLEKENTPFDFYGNDAVKFVRKNRE